MKLHEMKPAEGSRKARKRVGRGIGSGTGKTSGRGHDGQNARSGGGVRLGFEGGQIPLFQRLPKRGFTNVNRKEYAIVNVEKLNLFEEGTEVTPELLLELGVVSNAKAGIKILYTLLLLIVFRIGTFITVPNVDATALQQTNNTFIGFLNTFGGGALINFSILAMGIMPYITASIIVQLLQMDVVPKFTEWAKQGDVGRRKLAQFTRYFTIVLAFVQAIAMSFGFNQMYDGTLIKGEGISTYVIIALVLTAGTAFLLWLGEQITERGVGNGISIIIFAGIVAGVPNAVNQLYATQIQGAGDQLFIRLAIMALLLLVIIAITVGVVYVHEALRKIPIQYAKRVSGRNQTTSGQQTHLPLKLNAAGVIPVIFAVAFFVTPQSLGAFLGENKITTAITSVFNYNEPIGMVIYVGLIIAFTYFYAFIQVNPENVADNLKKQGAYIPGIRPGINTQNYLTSTLYRLTFVGALFLATISVMPIFFINFANLPQSLQIGGTSLLIVVGVALETMKQLESQLVKRHYKGFMK